MLAGLTALRFVSCGILHSLKEQASVRMRDSSQSAKGTSVRHLPWIAVGIAIVAVVMLAYPALQTQKKLRVVETQWVRANEQVVKARAAAAQLEKVVGNLKAELAAANTASRQFQENVDEANSDNEHLRMQLDAARSGLKANLARGVQLTAELEKTKTEIAKSNDQTTALRKRLENTAAMVDQLTREKTAAESTVTELRSQSEAMEAKLEKADRAADQERTRNGELEKRVANLTAELQKADGQRIELGEKLDAANAEIERLKSLEQ